MGNFDNLLNDIYYINKNFDGIDTLYKKSKLLNKDIRKDDVKAWLNKQMVTQLTTAEKIGEKKEFLPIYSETPYAFQIDLSFLPKYKRKNSGYYILFTAINVNTRYAYAYYAKNKETDSIIEMLEEFLKNAIDINIISCDYGSEFISKVAKDWFEKNNIKVYYTLDEGHSKLAIVNRFHRTLKDKLNKFFITTGSVRWIDSIDEIIKNYNNTVNIGIGFTPKEASKSLIETFLINRAKEKTDLINSKNIKENDNIIIGKQCRIINQLKIFDRMKIKFSNDVYTITKVNKNTVDLENDKNIISNVKKTSIKIVDIVENNIISNERKEVEKAYKVENELKKEGIKEENIVREQRIRKPPERLHF